MAKHLDPLWTEAQRRCLLDGSTLRMARELGLNPRSLIQSTPSKRQPWKAPVKDWTATCTNGAMDAGLASADQTVPKLLEASTRMNNGE